MIQPITAEALMADGTRHEGIPVLMVDRIAYSDQAQRRRWGAMTEDPDRWSVFITWHALHRTGRYGSSFDTFVGECVAVDASMGDELDPTRSAPTES